MGLKLSLFEEEPHMFNLAEVIYDEGEIKPLYTFYEDDDVFEVMSECIKITKSATQIMVLFYRAELITYEEFCAVMARTFAAIIEREKPEDYE